MPEAPQWFIDLLGWKPATDKTAHQCIRLFDEPIAPNLSDLASGPSMRLAAHVYKALGVSTAKRVEDLEEGESGTLLENRLKADLESALEAEDPDRVWSVDRHRPVTDFAQFLHLDEIQRVLDENPTLRATFGGDYQIETDVCVGVENSADSTAPEFLHAAISSKWTIRSDRVQNVRHEFATLVRNRRGRSPHLVVVTAEPLPTRILSIARGTGEVDTVYHVLYQQLSDAVSELWDGLTKEQKTAWTEMIDQKRLRSYENLVTDLTLS
ncbi:MULTISPECIES: NgoMIV family type II restriction endonuclease [unclassified Mycobacterium]|uniref:NgoMIV family type II restriction endonuclease n=1 Tax=unclassified Mycobacterium TaxID=2642494 RepID=UPI0007404D51|nr:MULTISPECIES: NgoMIV family type II restriction endonuclease [unclassified Mycobacterium]KUH81405.1 hypothetical protein AU185_16125 [Mycobacterium sp. GA-0227b]KUH83534.1 hypothetical protein AU186_15815 [Mycobacterium sp. GA-1999]